MCKLAQHGLFGNGSSETMYDEENQNLGNGTDKEMGCGIAIAPSLTLGGNNNKLVNYEVS